MQLNRRVAIGAGAVAGAALFAACGSNVTPAATSSAGGAAAALATTDAVPAGGSLVVTANDTAYALAKNADGTIVAHSAICTHMGCTVGAAGAELDCGCHGSKFDAFTGAVINGPANGPLAEVAVTASNGSIVLA